MYAAVDDDAPTAATPPPPLAPSLKWGTVGGDGASVATDDIANEYASFEAGQLEAREKSFEAISSTVTDDEFNSLFGPVQ